MSIGMQKSEKVIRGYAIQAYVNFKILPDNIVITINTTPMSKQITKHAAKTQDMHGRKPKREMS